MFDSNHCNLICSAGGTDIPQTCRTLASPKSKSEGKALCLGLWGGFWRVQSKFNFNGNKDYIGKVLMTDVHFGQQLPLGNHFVFRYHVGLGYAKNFDYQYTSLYPALNVAFGYHF